MTGISSTAGLFPGIMSVSGTGIPSGAQILSVDSPTQITLSSPATANGTPTITQTGNGLLAAGATINVSFTFATSETTPGTAITSSTTSVFPAAPCHPKHGSRDRREYNAHRELPNH